MTIEEKINELQAQIDELKIEAKRNKKTLCKNEKYYFVTIDGGVSSLLYINDGIDKQLINYNNVFDASFSKEEHLKWYAENVMKVQNRLMQLHEELCPDYFPDWKANNMKFSVIFDNTHKEWAICDLIKLNFSTVCFTKEAAEAAVDILNAEKFMMNEKEKSE